MENQMTESNHIYSGRLAPEKITFTCRICGNDMKIPAGDFDHFLVCYPCRQTLKKLILQDRFNETVEKNDCT